MSRLVRQACPGCGADVMHMADVDTDEPLVIDDLEVDDGNVAVYRVKGFAVARRYGRPARIQPAWREHVCPTPTVTTPPAAKPFDPYEDEPAAVQQHGGWRA